MNNFSKEKLLLHSCCAPCLTSVYEQLYNKYDIVVFWYNPNIWPKKEHDKRLEILKEYCQKIGAKLKVSEYDYHKEHVHFNTLVKGYELDPERGKRCEICYEMRLRSSAEYAKNNKFDLFCSELSVSPHKNAEILNQLGNNIENQLGIKYLVSDFKKDDGFARSVHLSKEHNLYRQNYCGCRYSKKNNKLRIKNNGK